jgi:hypothetical protein
VSGFPVDDATLVMLAAACEVNPDTGRSHLLDFLHMGTQEKSREDVSHEVGGEIGEGVAFFIEYEEGAAPFSPHDVIRALVTEIQRLREVTA